MAKKTKVVEIKSVPTEPQRGAGQDASYDDPVGIYYPVGGIARLIGSLAGGDEDEAVIKTGGCIVEHDINVRYAAPTPVSSFAGTTLHIVFPENGEAALTLTVNDSLYLPVMVGDNMTMAPETEERSITINTSMDIPALILYNDGVYFSVISLITAAGSPYIVTADKGTVQVYPESEVTAYVITYENAVFPSDITITVAVAPAGGLNPES